MISDYRKNLSDKQRLKIFKLSDQEMKKTDEINRQIPSEMEEIPTQLLLTTATLL